MSVLDKAMRLQAVARTYAEGAAERREREQAAVALERVEDALALLRQRMNTARAATNAGIPLPDVSRTAVDGLANLQKAKGGEGVLPSARTLQNAQRKLEGNRKDIDTALAAAWKAWAEQSIGDIPAAKISLTAPADRRIVDDDMAWLRGAARRSPSAEDVRMFRLKHARVCDVLDGVRSDAGIVALMDRITTTGLLLAELTEDELALLRSDTNASRQIVLRPR